MLLYLRLSHRGGNHCPPSLLPDVREATFLQLLITGGEEAAEFISFSQLSHGPLHPQASVKSASTSCLECWALTVRERERREGGRGRETE